MSAVRLDEIRKNAQFAQGESLVEIPDIPLDYYVHPADEFRMSGGVLYQLMPKAAEVRINMWDTNSRP